MDNKRKDQVGVAGENATIDIALKVFYGEFVFEDLWFSHKDIGQGSNVELADLIISLGNDLLAFQIKTRDVNSSGDGDEKWIKNRTKDAKDQLVVTFNNLQIKGLPQFVNKKGDMVKLKPQGLFSGIIILKNETINYYQKVISCKRLNGLVHCFSYNDFCICCTRLLIPADLLSYLSFRERYYPLDTKISENEEICVDKFLISKYGESQLDDGFIEPFKGILNQYKSKLIDGESDLNTYREIIEVMAMFDRIEIDIFCDLLGKVQMAAKEYLCTDNLFMKPCNQNKHSVLFLSADKWNEQHAKHITELFMYKTKTEKCLTVAVCFEDEGSIRIEWILKEQQWERDNVMEQMIKELGIENKWTPKKYIMPNK